MSKSVRDKTRPVRPILPARRPSCLSKFVPPRLLQLPPPPRLAPQPRLSAAGEGAFTVITHTPQPFSEEICRNPEISSEPVQNQCVATSLKAPSAKPPNQAPCLTRRQESRAASTFWEKLATRHKRPPESRGPTQPSTPIDPVLDLREDGPSVLRSVAESLGWRHSLRLEFDRVEQREEHVELLAEPR